MTITLEDELGDIMQKARDGKSWSQADLAIATDIALADIQRMERYDLIPPESTIAKIAFVLDLHAPSLVQIANGQWVPRKQEPNSPDYELVCLEVLMGSYQVKCYLIICKKTKTTAIIDTGANPGAIISKCRELGVKPDMILLTHAHPDHAGGLGELDKEFACPSWIDAKEPMPSGSRDLRIVEDGQLIALGEQTIEVLATPGHTPGGVSFRIGDSVLSGDAIFAGSMGRANTSWQGLFQSITKRLLTLPDHIQLFPGHGPATTVGEEKQNNPFFYGKVPA
jgi:glyoxylase-like metal-dependent hydrolase (beta-lactamase superfamily II)